MTELEDMLEHADKEVGIIPLVTGTTEDGYNFWAYVSITPSKYDDFKKAQSGGEYVLSEYGDVLHSGMGDQPPQEEIKRMIDEYGIDPDFEEKAREMAKNISDNI